MIETRFLDLSPNNKQQTLRLRSVQATNNQQPTTNNKQQTTNNQQPTTYWVLIKNRNTELVPTKKQLLALYQWLPFSILPDGGKFLP